MKNLTQILTMGGFGLLATLATGAGPAHAATANVVPVSKTLTAHHVQWRPGDDVVGYYRTLRDCELAGRFGERTGHWDDHNCAVVRIGLRRGAWALQVASNNDWDRHGFGVPFRATHGFPNQFRPVWAGTFNPGPGHDHAGPGFPGAGHDGPGLPGPGHDHAGPGLPGAGNTQTGPGTMPGGPGTTHSTPGTTQTGPGTTHSGPGNTPGGPGTTHSTPGNTQTGMGSAPQPGTTAPTRGMGH